MSNKNTLTDEQKAVIRQTCIAVMKELGNDELIPQVDTILAPIWGIVTTKDSARAFLRALLSK